MRRNDSWKIKKNLGSTMNLQSLSGQLVIISGHENQEKSVNSLLKSRNFYWKLKTYLNYIYQSRIKILITCKNTKLSEKVRKNSFFKLFILILNL